MAVEYKLEPEDVASARLLAIGIRPKLEFALFVLAIALLLAWSVSPWSIGQTPLVTGLAAGLGGFRLIQIAKIREAAAAAFQRNTTLRQPTTASWDASGVVISPASSMSERISWKELRAIKINERIVLLEQKTGSIHAIPKRAFANREAIAAFRALARGVA
jgi:hypothetical protein